MTRASVIEALNAAVDADDVLLRERAEAGREGRADAPAGDVTLLCASDLRMQPIRWLWPGWLAAGKLHIVGGAPGTGKTTLALALASTLTVAGRWPDATRCAEAADVLIWSGEDDPNDTLLPRLAAAGADLARVHIIGDVRDPDGRRPFDPARDVPALAHAVALLRRPVRLLIVDPIVSAVSGDSHKNAETRRGLQPLVDLGQRLGAAVLGITHLTKGTTGRDPLERLTGSLAFGALTRIAWATAVQRDPEPGAPRRVLARIKSNIGIDGGGFGYDLEAVTVADGIQTSRVLWGAQIEGDARALLGQAEAEPDTGDDADDERTERDEAGEWLRSVLAEGPLNAADLKLLAQRNGLAWRTVRRAKDALGVQSKKGAMRGGWTWQLPEGVQGGHEGAEGVHSEKAGHLRPLRQDVDTFGEREEGEL